MRFVFSHAFTLAASLFVAEIAHLASAQPGPGSVICPNAPVRISGATDSDAATICEGVGDAIGFFRSLELKPLALLQIAVRTQLPPEVSTNAAGCFLERENLIVLLPYEKFAEIQTWFNVRITRSLYRSLAAHETAHALAACNFSIPKPTIRAKEYIAYVATFVTMEPGLRARVMEEYPQQDYKRPARLTFLLCTLAPMRFGVEAYRHYLRPENGSDWLRKVLTGAVLND